MKAKFIMGIVIGCLSVALVGLLVSQRVQAQSSPGPGYWPEGLGDLMWVKFAEDYMQKHGREIKSYNANASPEVVTFLDTVPANKRYIVTDIMSSTSSGNVVISLSADVSELDRRAATPGDWPSIGLQSGIVFQQNESIYFKANASTIVTISGYYVDMP